MYSIAYKRTFGSLLLTLMLVLSIAPAFTAADSGCTMKCGRNKRTCCCRKGSAPNTIAATTCPAGCCRLNTIPTFATALAIPPVLITPLPNVSAPLLLLQLTPLFAILCFALSQRPPPQNHLPAL